MSIPQFSQLEGTEKALLFNTPAIITLLVGGVDDNLDEKEIAAAHKTIIIKSNEGDIILNEYFDFVENNFDEVLIALLNQYSGLQADVRTDVLVEMLSKLNDILPQIDALYAKALLKVWKSIAKEVANASGGFLGMMSSTYDEKHLAELGMITYKV
ncbi:MAG: hypothetical protein H6553_09020 [Chitinophagales bacterium]|nr:hypothetical protein [Chitinophagales bacterium]